MHLPDFIAAPNQRTDPSLYEIENAAIDPDGSLWNALAVQAPWQDRTVLDLGCGSGFWLPRYHLAAKAIGVEPDPDLVPLATQRQSHTPLQVLRGSAEHIPLPDASVDVVHARFAYFFPSEHFDPAPGLAEVSRVLRPGGALVVIDNDHVNGEFAQLLAASPWAAGQGRNSYPTRWWADQGAVTTPVLSSWRFATRSDLEDVLRLEFPAEVADPWLAAHPDRTVLSYGYLLHTWRKPFDEALSADLTMATYDRIADDYADRFPGTDQEQPAELGMIEQFAALVQGERAVLDAGCGAGRMLPVLAAAGCVPRGVDLSAGMIARAQTDHPTYPIGTGDLQELPFPDASFDGWFSWYSTIHLDDAALARAVTQARRVLRPGGMALAAFQSGDRQREVGASLRALGHPVQLWRQHRTADQVAAAFDLAGFTEIARMNRAPVSGEADPQAVLIFAAP